jgi:symplekin
VTHSYSTIPGLDALRELVTLKPPVRAEALRIILDLTTHPGILTLHPPQCVTKQMSTETILRIAAIKAVKRWVPDIKPMDHISQRFAVRLLRRLESHEPSSVNGDALAPETEMQDAKEPHSDARKAAEPWQNGEASLSTPYLPTAIELPARPARILQHVQLIFALCVKVPDLLEECVISIFVANAD